MVGRRYRLEPGREPRLRRCRQHGESGGRRCGGPEGRHGRECHGKDHGQGPDRCRDRHFPAGTRSGERRSRQGRQHGRHRGLVQQYSQSDHLRQRRGGCRAPAGRGCGHHLPLPDRTGPVAAPLHQGGLRESDEARERSRSEARPPEPAVQLLGAKRRDRGRPRHLRVR